MIIRGVGIRSCARIVAVIYAVWGLLAGFSMFVASAMGFSQAADAPEWAGAFFGPAAILLMPILYAAFAYIFAALGCWIFNWAATTIGGLEIEVE